MSIGCRKKLAPKPGTKPRPKLKPELEAAWREQQRARRPSPSPATTPQDLYDVPKATSSSSQEAIYDRPKEQGHSLDRLRARAHARAWDAISFMDFR